jgi:hypothetical protein
MDPMTAEVAEPPRAPRRPRSGPRAALVAGVGLALWFLWLRGLPGFVAWEVARDHQRCFGRRQLAARLWSEDPWEVRAWLESRGTPVQPLPKRAGSVEIVGVRYCPLLDRIAAHVYYGGEGSLVSVFVLSGPARVGTAWSGVSHGLQVRLIPSAGRIVAIVGESAPDVDAVARAFLSTVAWVDRPAVAC